MAGCLEAVIDAVFDFSTRDFGGQTILHHAVYAELQSREKLETCLGKGFEGGYQFLGFRGVYTSVYGGWSLVSLREMFSDTFAPRSARS